MDTSEVLAERYQLGDVIGRGGTADVYRARDLLLDREVAVKVLRDPTGDDDDRARFIGEARTLAGMSHRGLVVVLDTGLIRDRPFLVMELVEGATLSRVIARGPTPSEPAARIGLHVAEALSYVHSRGVVHRDVKPGNVLIGTDGRVKLADFGIARLIGDTVRHTRTGHTIGTAAYLAPEQVLGGEVSPAADIYALGLVLLEALTGVRAFPGTPTEAALARVHAAPIIPVSLAPRWQRLLRAMTSHEASERPTADEVAVELRALSRESVDGPGVPIDAGESTMQIAATPSSTPSHLDLNVVAHRRRTSRARRALVLVACTLLLALVGGLASTRDDEPAPREASNGVPTGTPTPTPTGAPTPDISVPASATTVDAAVASAPAQPAAAPQQSAGASGKATGKTKNKSKGKSNGKGHGKSKR